MTNNERFNSMLNNCQNPRAVVAVLSMLARAGEREADLILRLVRGMVGEVTAHDEQ